jgi:hypothetical protein
VTDRLAELESAIRAQAALICDARVEITNYLSGEIGSQDFADRIIRLFDGSRHRHVQRHAREALADGEKWQYR